MVVDTDAVSVAALDCWPDQQDEVMGDRGFSGAIESPSYDSVFSRSIETIDLTCDAFEPEG